MEKEYKYGMIRPDMKEIGKMISQMDMALYLQMEMYIKDIGKIIEQMEMVYI